MKKNTSIKMSNSQLKSSIIVIIVLVLSFGTYVVLVNRNSQTMTGRQKILKAVYPAFMWFSQLTGKNTKTLSNEKAIPTASFYALKSTLNDGKEFDFSSLRGKKVLLVNTASDCGYTNQYHDLEKLYSQFKSNLVVLGFPSNDFKEQEKGSDDQIAAFCKVNFGVTFPLMKKSTVTKKPDQNTIFQWLTDSSKNGWNNKPPSWNFSKYLVSEEGILMNYFDPSVEPLSTEVTAHVK